MKNRTIVFLGNIRFDGTIQATSLFIARMFAKHNKVFFIDYPITLKDYFTADNTDESQHRKGKFSPNSDGVIDTDLANLKVIVCQPVLPINFLPEGKLFRSALKINELIIASRISSVLKKAKITDFVYINSFNFHYPHIAQLIKPALTIYQCVDPMIVPYDMKHGIVSEQMLVKESDVVICTSKALYKEKKDQNLNTYFVPNAADVEHFNTACRDDVPIHKKIKDLPGPIIGYLGSVERRMDYNLLAEVIRDNADKTFVFAGPVRDSYSTSIFKFPNVLVTGPIPYAEAPQVVKGFDVAIIPFKKDSVSNTIFPLKLFEYLGAGKPVILTDFNLDLKDYTDDTVWYCSGVDEFNSAITKALQPETDTQIKRRLGVARQNTWEKRAEDIGKIIEEHLNKPAVVVSLVGTHA